MEFFQEISQKKILIVGAGIAGLSLARQLKKLNIPFMIIERRNSLSTEGAGIALPANAMQALRYLELDNKIEQHAYQVHKIIYTDSKGNLLSEASLLEPPLNSDRFVALHRYKFHEILSEGISDIHFNTTIEKFSPTPHGVHVQFNNTKLNAEEFSAVIGADGVSSQVRQLTFADQSLVDLGVTIWRWTCEYPTHNLQPTYMAGMKNIFMAYPIGENEIYCYAHVFDPESLNSKNSDHQASLKYYFGEYGGIAQTMLMFLPDNQFIIPGRLRAVPNPLFAKGRIALVGDAGHACSPMLQQGAALALEDIIVLSKFLENFPVPEALVHYACFRSERVNWVSASSDGPMKMLINMTPEIWSEVQKRIRENGPLNVQGWRKLLVSSPLKEIMPYLDKWKTNDKEEKVENLNENNLNNPDQDLKQKSNLDVTFQT